MRTLTIALSFAATALAPGAEAQERPDFSGEWTITMDDQRGPGPAAAIEFGSGWGRTITIEQDASTLTVLWPFYTRGDLQPPLRFIYALDGSPTTTTVLMGRGMQEQVSRTSWRGDTLVITTDHAFPHPDDGRRATTTLTRRLSLASPASLIVETTIDGEPGGPPTASRTVYTRS
ncbi:MAG: hypothetical protein ACREIV_00095 [Planctomycetaceae bacterium]